MSELEAEKARLTAMRDAGTDCRACGQHVKRYVRTLNEARVAELIDLYVLDARGSTRGADGGVHCRQFAGRSGDYAKLRYPEWAFIEEVPVVEGRKTNGWWRITPRGRLFVRGEIAVVDRLYVYMDEYDGVPEDAIRIRIYEAMRKKHSDAIRYNEAMKLRMEQVGLSWAA